MMMMMSLPNFTDIRINPNGSAVGVQSVPELRIDGN